MARHQLYVLSNPVEGREEEYNTWYTDQHLPDVLRAPGFVAAQRFKITERVAGTADYSYLAVYEMEAADPHDAVVQLLARAGTADMVMSEALDPEFLVVLCEAITPLVRRG